MRDFVTSHADYQQDSRVSDVINYDLMRRCQLITLGEAEAPDLLPCHDTRTRDDIPLALERADAYESKVKASKKIDDARAATVVEAVTE